jgi:hypothetical protein
LLRGCAPCRKAAITPEACVGAQLVAAQRCSYVEQEMSVLAASRQRDSDEALTALVEQLRAAPDSVIPFIGAGISQQFGYPGWREFSSTRPIRAGRLARRRSCQ